MKLSFLAWQPLLMKSSGSGAFLSGTPTKHASCERVSTELINFKAQVQGQPGVCVCSIMVVVADMRAGKDGYTHLSPT